MGNLLPDIVNKPHLKAFDDMVEQRNADLSFAALLIYMIDTVPAIALPYIAETFDVLGFKGWRFADTEQKQRDLLKTAIKIRRFAGTPWSIKEALKAIGIFNCQIIEGHSLLYDDSVFYDGQYVYGVGSWAEFRVLIAAANFTVIDQALIDNIIGIVNEWKNARSHLVDISFSNDDQESVTLADTISMTVEHPANHLLDFGLTF